MLIRATLYEMEKILDLPTCHEGEAHIGYFLGGFRTYLMNTVENRVGYGRLRMKNLLG